MIPVALRVAVDVLTYTESDEQYSRGEADRPADLDPVGEANRFVDLWQAEVVLRD